MRRVYLDHNATSPMRPEVREALLEAIDSLHGNASSLHAEGRAARRLLEDARERIAAALDAHPDEVFFTSGGTESNNTAILGLSLRTKPPSSVTVSAVEHPSVYELAQPPGPLAERSTVIPVSAEGVVCLERLEVLLRNRARVVAVMHANNETGVIQPIEEVADLCRRYGAYLHVDAVQSVGRLAFSFASIGASTASISGHKLQGPPGIGLLLIRRGTRLQPLLFGGPQERGLRPGTEAVALAHAMARAVELAVAERSEQSARLRRLRDQFENAALSLWPPARVNGAGAPRLPNTSNICFPGLDGQALVMALDMEGVAASTGSACSSGAAAPSHVLLAMGLPEELARASVRFSFGPGSTDEDVQFALDRLQSVLRRLVQSQR